MAKNLKNDAASPLNEDMFVHVSDTDLAWMAGLLQGEANFTMDKRVRSKSGDPEYIPPPPTPIIKIDMVEEDVMTHLASLVGEKVLPLKRQTTGKKNVYRVTIQQRAKTEAFLKKLLPYVVGAKTSDKIKELLEVCDQYNKWRAAGGPSKAGRLAAKIKLEKNK